MDLGDLGLPMEAATVNARKVDLVTVTHLYQSMGVEAVKVPPHRRKHVWTTLTAGKRLYALIRARRAVTTKHQDIVKPILNG